MIVYEDLLRDMMKYGLTIYILITIQLLHSVECDMMFYGALESNIDQGRRPRSILLSSAP
jgi:hypothetical protein